MTLTATDSLLRDIAWTIGESLREKGWTTSDTGDPNVETERDGTLVNDLCEQFAFLLNEQVFMLLMEAKAAALRAEADVLDMQVHKWNNQGG